MSICEENNCTGCMACYNACPKHCISMNYNNLGILMPSIDKENCIRCNICSKICPSNKFITKNEILEAYACWSLDKNQRKTSSSGGIASIFYEQIINENGIVFGCNYDENLQLKFSYTDSLKEIEKYKTSKYSQAYIGESFKKAREFLEQNRKVLFIGTPCQVAGLKNYLNKDFQNLITVDLICHGTPSQKYIDEYIKSLNLSEKPTNITFRGLYDYYFTLYKNDKIIYSQNSINNKYFYSFLSGLYCRESCYQCIYATPQRISDISIGDFWGLGKETPFEYDTSLGVSLALINTEEGKNLFENIKDKIFFEKREIKEALKENEQLNHPIKKNKNFKKFQELYIKYGFEKALNECWKGE